ncbi:hypothetical protein [Thermococcus sp. JdF3]|uniref:hypothetical protein n=1 Tax=Thermococcus sp. JdF3 TaxID=1638258 RepID=UPI00143A318A|nr:hypothetical protein [Thermococcus sp. JdF3]NJE00496.1 hypothetical protein [Thermococcus sp. JdF3]
MNRTFKTIVILFLFLTLFSKTVVSVESVDYVYNVRYSVISNGSDAFIPLLILTYEPYCPPLSGINCANATTGEVLGGEEYLFYFNDSQLHILNFTPAFRALYPNYSTLLDQFRALYPYILSHSLNGARFINGSWYLNLTFYPPMTHVHGIYLFNPKNLCIGLVNVSWLKLPRGKISDEINGWRIELQSPSFKKWDYANMSDVWITMSKNALRWSPGPTEVVNSSVFPIYFLLKKEGHVKNITLVYLNMNVTRDDFVPPNAPFLRYWFPDSVKIANVTVCEKANVTTSTSTTAGTSTAPNRTTISSNTTKTPTSTKETKDGICGSGLLVLATLISAVVTAGRCRR